MTEDLSGCSAGRSANPEKRNPVATERVALRPEAMAETFTGNIERVTFHNEENGFSVLRVRGSSSSGTVVGHAIGVREGETIEANGEWVTDPRRGRQFKADAIRVVPPSTKEGIQKYLGSGMVKGIGPSLAARLVKAFGAEVFSVIEETPDRLLEVSGIGADRQAKILEAWKGHKAVRDIMVFLHSHGVGPGRAVRIFKTYGYSAVAILRSNPYRLASDIQGIGFKIADDIALRIGIDRHSLDRARAGLLHTLSELNAAGHCAWPREALLEKAAELLGIPDTILTDALFAELESGGARLHDIDGTAHVYPAHLFSAEKELASGLLRLLKSPSQVPQIDAERALAWVEQEVGLTLAESQQNAVRQALQQKILVITGGPGVGKTTIVNSILKILTTKRVRCKLCAPTGRAARRLAETTGMEAMTIHRMLEFQPHRNVFRFDGDNQLDCDCVVLDEASMVDVVLMRALVDAIPRGARFIVVGDSNQLPSVGPGQVLADLLESGAVPVVRLEEVFRQAAQSQIVTNAHRILHGEDPELGTPDGSLGDFYFVPADGEEQTVSRLERLLTERIPERFGLDPVRDVQVLVPMNRSPLGAHALNRHLQAFLNKEGPPQVSRFGHIYRQGDKVMQIENNYDKSVFNGDVGFLTHVSEEDDEFRVEFDGQLVSYRLQDLDELVPAYACSVHKSQGSEYPAIILPLHTQYYVLLRRSILYTAVTRAKKLVVVLGTRRALALALREHEAETRLTGLRQALLT